MKSTLVFQNSPWLILICIIIGLSYAWLLYSGKNTFNKTTKNILFGLRAFLVSVLVFLLINPLLKSNETVELKPKVILAVDNSSSLSILPASSKGSLKSIINAFQNRLAVEGLDVEIRNIEKNQLITNADSLNFDAAQTDFGTFFNSLKEEFDGQNLQKVVLFSDGIATNGISPLNYDFPFEIDALGVGDSTIKKDLAIKGLVANKLAYLGNDFPVQVEISSHLFGGKSSSVIIRNEGKVVAQKNIAFTSSDDFQIVPFNLPADKAGKLRFTVELLPLSGEFTTKNNYRELIIDVVDGKEKVLLLANAAHPDIKALKAIIDKNPLFQLSIKIVNDGNLAAIAAEDFDILILHQLPSIRGAGADVLSKLMAKNKPTFFVLGAMSDVSKFNGIQNALAIAGYSGKIDKILGGVNNTFKRFEIPEATYGVISGLPPLTAPFGDYKSLPGNEVILRQMIGNVDTSRPLLLVNTSLERKTAIMTAEGIWEWRLQEYQQTETQDLIDDVVLKTLQLIAIKEDKNKLRVYTTQSAYTRDNPVIFQAEGYNDLLERIYDFDVNLTVSGSTYRKTFSYKVSEEGGAFELSGLKPGVYNYVAQSTLLGKSYKSDGQFVITDQDLELLNTTADFNFLRTLASKNNGKFAYITNANTLLDTIEKSSLTSKLINSETLKELIHSKWWLYLLLLLVTAEWILRKYFGNY